MDYKSAGVDTEKAQTLIKGLQDTIQSTFKVPGVGSIESGIGGFSGIFSSVLPLGNYDIAATTDGVGTKIQLLRETGYLQGVGYDLTGMCVNDLYCAGATPAFFLDYIACGKLHDSWYKPVLTSIAEACKSVPMALLGGETAEHPGVMKDNDFDLAGFCVGFLEKGKKLPRTDIMTEGDCIIALPASGPHSNGFSLIRKLIETSDSETKGSLANLYKEKEVFIEQFLSPTRIYRFIPDLLRKAVIKGIAHITGGGIYENLPRILPSHLSAEIHLPEPFPLPAFQHLKQFVKEKDLHHTFNMGSGILLVADSAQLQIVREFEPLAVVSGYLVKNASFRVHLKGIDT